ncbi:MAG: tyrosine protein kinase [Herbinix sp.]|jgi:capsular exopolysaccharide synthesis family protein|nr:tyrosine protein kinase [Herbinix sp.]
MLQINLERNEKPDFRSNEAFKQLRTNLIFCGKDIKIIGFTSSIPSEGKSNISFNVAVSLSEIDKKVLFIDADLRRSILIGRYMPDHAVVGLSHYLSGLNSLDEILYESNIPNLDIIFTGPVPPNPAELLGSNTFTGMINNLREEYDYIIIDTPPLGSVIDSVIVAESCDGIVFIIEANAISYKFAQNVKGQLEKSNCKILGAVLNKVDFEQRHYPYYMNKYEKYSKKYYSEE